MHKTKPTFPVSTTLQQKLTFDAKNVSKHCDGMSQQTNKKAIAFKQ